MPPELRKPANLHSGGGPLTIIGQTVTGNPDGHQE
jgi:hypothetical protein